MVAVTVKWWDDVWLHEGFASFLAYSAVNAVHPEWEIMSQIPSLHLAPALMTDGQLSSRPIVTHASNVDEIKEILDLAVYQKVM